MPSTISWLDTTAEQQRIAREMVSLFMRSESRDELGVAQIRDVLSNWLFPGTSVLQARARYFILIPWCYQIAEERSRRIQSKSIDQHVRDVQREMIVTMKRDFPSAAGLIGKDAGASIKALPRDLFWSGLVTFDIRRSESYVPPPPRHGEGEATELAIRHPTMWDPDIPTRPVAFPEEVPHGLDMSPAEAQWLSERMRTDREDTYLSYLLTLDPEIIEPASALWDVPVDRHFPEREHAERFSWTMHGASLAYNLLVARRYAANPDLNAVDGAGRVEHFEERIREWAGTMSPGTDPRSWNVDEFVADVTERNPRINSRTWRFVREWLRLCTELGPESAAMSEEAGDLIRAREQRKGSKSRLGGNIRMLESWGGSSGDGRLLFRWPVIKQLLLDINGGHGTQEVTRADA